MSDGGFTDLTMDAQRTEAMSARMLEAGMFVSERGTFGGTRWFRVTHVDGDGNETWKDWEAVRVAFVREDQTPGVVWVDANQMVTVTHNLAGN